MSNLKIAREKANMSQKEVAIELKVSAPTVSEWESGKKNPNAKNLKKLSKLYNTTTDYLLENHIHFAAYLNRRAELEDIDAFAKKCEIDAELLKYILGKGPQPSKSQHPGCLGTYDMRRMADELKVDWRYLACLYDGYNPHLINGIRIPEDDVTNPPLDLLELDLTAFGTPVEGDDGGLTMDGFTYAMQNEAKDLPQEKKDMLLSMARFMKQELETEKGKQ